ncbi:MAG: PilN domain-containing protein [Candidatus Aminicenantales bacterium]
MIRINLLKPEKKELREIPSIPTPKVKKEKKFQVSYLILLVLVVSVVALFLSQKSAINKERNLLNVAQQEKEQLQYVLEKLEKLEQQKETLERKIHLITRLKAQQPVAVRIMDELSKNIPEWVWLTETSYKDQTIEIKGRALSNNLIADYIYNLENSRYLQNVNLISSTQRTEQNNQFLEFTLTARYVLPGTYSELPGKQEEKK